MIPGEIAAGGDVAVVADVFEVLKGDMNPVRLMERLKESSMASTWIIVHWSAHCKNLKKDLIFEYPSNN